MYHSITQYLNRHTNAAPLAVFRILFGLMMVASIIRFWMNGWIESFYIEPIFHFSYYGFEWVKPIGEYTYIIFIICGLSAIFVALGYKYRLAIILFFLSFTYIELMDKTTYLNHYYFISLMSFLLIFLPADRYFSLHTYLSPKSERKQIPQWTIFVVQFLLAIVYFYAGLAKLNSDWLIEAMPLKIWLPSNQDLPFVGDLLTKNWFIYAMAWFGALYDLTIPFLLWNQRTRWFAYLMVIIFHVFTRILFPIGMFPYVMILSTLIFFSPSFHNILINNLKSLFYALGFKKSINPQLNSVYTYTPWNKRVITSILVIFFSLQVLLPFRYSLYPGELFWNEEGYRFSWRVMLIEKAGYTTFIVKEGNSNRQVEVEPSEYLTAFQEKQMSFQADFILEFAHFLADEYEKKGYSDPQVYANSFVAFNGRRSKRFINPNVDLAKEEQGLHRILWILPFEEKIYGL